MLTVLLVKYNWDPVSLRRAALLVWKSLSRYICSSSFKHSKTFCFINVEELLLVCVRSFGLEGLDSEVPMVPDVYLTCPCSVVDVNGKIFKPLILYCQRNWPEEWNVQTSSDEDNFVENSDKHNFNRAKEWFKHPVVDLQSEDFWANALNPRKKRKCTRDLELTPPNSDDRISISSAEYEEKFGDLDEIADIDKSFCC